jgi:hypothetical protein
MIREPWQVSSCTETPDKSAFCVFGFRFARISLKPCYRWNLIEQVAPVALGGSGLKRAHSNWTRMLLRLITVKRFQFS